MVTVTVSARWWSRQEVANSAIKYSDRPGMNRRSPSDSASAHCRFGVDTLSQEVPSNASNIPIERVKGCIYVFLKNSNDLLPLCLVL
jgi:hypothetical protein